MYVLGDSDDQDSAAGDGAVAEALGGEGQAPGHTIEHRSDAGVFNVVVPGSHSQRSNRSGSHNLVSGPARWRRYTAVDPTDGEPIALFALVHNTIPAHAERGYDSDEALLRALANAALASVDGEVTGERPVSRLGTIGARFDFEGARPSDNRHIFGRIELFRTDVREIVAAQIIAHSEEALSGESAEQFFESLSYRARAERAPSAGLSGDLSGPCPRERIDSAIRSVPISQLERIVGDARGCVVLVQVYASWCPSCRSAFPTVVELGETYGNSGLRIRAFSVDEDVRALEAFLDHRRLPFRPLHLLPYQPGELSTALLGLGAHYQGSIPFFALFDRRGRLVDEFTGERGLRRLPARITSLL